MDLVIVSNLSMVLTYRDMNSLRLNIIPTFPLIKKGGAGNIKIQWSDDNKWGKKPFSNNDENLDLYSLNYY